MVQVCAWWTQHPSVECTIDRATRIVVIRWAMAKRNADKRYKLKLSATPQIAASMSPENAGAPVVAGDFRRSTADMVDAG